MTVAAGAHYAPAVAPKHSTNAYTTEEDLMPTPAGSAPYVGPRFAEAKVRDAMRVGVVTCRRQTLLRDAARIMVSYRIHSVVVDDDEGGSDPWALVTDLDVAEAARSDELSELTAGEVASSELVTVGADQTLGRAAQLMSEHEVTHLVAVQPETGKPVGVISALGLAAVVAAEHG